MLEPANVKLTAQERIIFNEIMEEREPSHWTAHRRQLAAALAKTMLIVQRAQDALISEGYVTHNGRGNPVLNPMARVLDQNMKTVCGYRRSLAIHARALGGDARDIARRREITLEQQRHARASDDDLLARPTVVPFRQRQEEEDD